MASDQLRVRIDGDLRERLQSYQEETGNDLSPFVRRAVDQRLRRQGYDSADVTALERGMRKGFTASLASSATLVALVLFAQLPAEVFVDRFVPALLVAAAACYLVAEYEPRVTRYVRGVMGR